MCDLFVNCVRPQIVLKENQGLDAVVLNCIKTFNYSYDKLYISCSLLSVFLLGGIHTEQKPIYKVKWLNKLVLGNLHDALA